MLQALNLDQLDCLVDFQTDEGLWLVHNILLDVENLSFYNGGHRLIDLLLYHFLKLIGKHIFDLNLHQVIDFADNLQIYLVLNLLFGAVNYLQIDLLLDDFVALLLHVRGDRLINILLTFLKNLAIHLLIDHHFDLWTQLEGNLLLNHCLELSQYLGLDFQGYLVFDLIIDLNLIVDLDF